MAVDWTKFSLIDAWQPEDASGRSRWTARFYMKAADLASRPTVGCSPPTSFPGPSGWVVTEVSAGAISPLQYVVQISVEASLPAASLSAASLVNEWDVGGDGNERLHFDPSWYAAMPPKDFVAPKGSNVDMTKYALAAPYAQYISSRRGTDKLPELPDAWASNTAVAAECPFTTYPDRKHFDHDIDCDAVRITIHRLFSSGVPPAFAGVCTIPETYGISSGSWRAISQRYDQTKDSQGTKYWRIERVLIKAPFGLTWDADIVGTATW